MVGSAVALATPAWAHGEVRPGRAAGGTTVAAVLVVPSERDGHRNKRIALALPPGFTPRSCAAPIGWRCTTADKGFSWERVTGLVEAEGFDLSMQVAGTPGTYVLPLSQTYDDDETRTFTGAPGSRDEAPLFTVTGTGGDGSAAPVPSTAASPTRPALASASAVATTSAAGTGASPRPTSSPAPTPAAEDTTAATSAAPAGGLAALPPGRRLAPPSSGDSPVALIALGFLALTVLAGAVLLVRGRQASDRGDA